MLQKIECELKNFPWNSTHWLNFNVGTKPYEIYAILWYSDQTAPPSIWTNQMNSKLCKLLLKLQEESDILGPETEGDEVK